VKPTAKTATDNTNVNPRIAFTSQFIKASRMPLLRIRRIVSNLKQPRSASASAVTKNLKIFQTCVFIGFRPIRAPLSTGLPHLRLIT
jgi:hypothetical protein